jgi:hypothetical protein
MIILVQRSASTFSETRQGIPAREHCGNGGVATDYEIAAAGMFDASGCSDGGGHVHHRLDRHDFRSSANPLHVVHAILQADHHRAGTQMWRENFRGVFGVDRFDA